MRLCRTGSYRRPERTACQYPPAHSNGFRGQTDTPDKMALRIRHNLWYIQNWSLWLDLKILLMTPLVLVHRNAY